MTARNATPSEPSPVWAPRGLTAAAGPYRAGLKRPATERAALGLPKNAAAGRTYSGINALILSDAVVGQGYSTQSWLTFKREGGGEPRAIPFLKRFTVFDAEQCEGLPDGISAAPPPVDTSLICLRLRSDPRDGGQHPHRR